jgi:hypothetical protein
MGFGGCLVGVVIFYPLKSVFQKNRDNLTRDFLKGTWLDQYCATIQWLGKSNIL